MNVYELAKKYYPALWDENRINVLHEKGKLTGEEVEDILNADTENVKEGEIEQ